MHGVIKCQKNGGMVAEANRTVDILKEFHVLTVEESCQKIRRSKGTL